MGHIFLTGLPGVGKTTLICRLCDLLREHSIATRGFFTTEIRPSSAANRSGFQMVSVEDRSLATLATVQPKVVGRCAKVGRYTVTIDQFEPFALDIFHKHRDDGQSAKVVFILDELGKMELCSAQFSRAAFDLFAEPNNLIVATVPIKPIKQLDPFVSWLKSPDSIFVTVNKENRDDFLSTLFHHVQRRLTASK